MPGDDRTVPNTNDAPSTLMDAAVKSGLLLPESNPFTRIGQPTPAEMTAIRTQLADLNAKLPQHPPMRVSGSQVNHPNHYQVEPFTCTEVRDVIHGFGLGYELACVIKYVLRAGKKEAVKEMLDLEKALNSLQKHIDLRKAEIRKSDTYAKSTQPITARVWRDNTVTGCGVDDLGYCVIHCCGNGKDGNKRCEQANCPHCKLLPRIEDIGRNVRPVGRPIDQT